MRNPWICMLLVTASLGSACAPSDCGPPDGTFLVVAELRAGDPEDCGGRVQEGLESYDNGRSRSSTLDCSGYRETSADGCGVDFDEECTGVDEFGPYRIHRIGSLSQTGGGRYEGVLDVEFLEYFDYEFSCVFDVTMTPQ